METEESAPSGSVSVNSSTRFLSSLMGCSGRLSCIFKAVQSCFLDAHALQPGPGEPAQAVENFDANIFRGRDIFTKSRDFFIQVLVVERFDNFPFDKSIKISQVRNHPRCLVDRAGYGHFDDVV